MMPPPRPRDRERESSRRKGDRSLSPPAKRKRSWLSSSHDRSHYERSPPPEKKSFKFGQPSNSISRRSRSRSPKYQKRSSGNVEGISSFSSRRDDRGRSPSRIERSDQHRASKRSMSPRADYKYSEKGHHREDRKHKHSSQSPDSSRYHGPTDKKKARQSSPSIRRSLSPALPPPSTSRRQDSSSHRPSERDNALPQRKVSSSSKKKVNRLTLHKRFSTDEMVPFQLQMKDNVTIAILRNPHAEPSEDVTIEKIFDSSLFKMVHKKTTGRRPIFEREEIKVWRHDENLNDDPDFEERRLVRVKGKKSTSSLMRMSPDVIRKSLGMNIAEEQSRSRSPHRSPSVRLNPQPDSRYESRYQQQINKDNADSQRRKEERRVDGGRDSRGDVDDDKVRNRREDREHGRESKLSKGSEDYDLRHALDRRRSGREEDFERGKREYGDFRRHQEDDRNVVMDQDRRRFNVDEEDRRDRQGGEFGGEQRRGWGRGRGRGPRRQWSPRRNKHDDRDGHDPRGGFDRRERFSFSPASNRGRGGGFRARGRGRGSSFTRYEEEGGSPPADDYYKYAEHDDRDIDPNGPGSRGGRGGRFPSRGYRGFRSFGGSRRSRGFRGNIRGGRGRFSRSIDEDDRRSLEPNMLEREWKHDMYDSVQSDDELPHSTTIIN